MIKNLVKKKKKKIVRVRGSIYLDIRKMIGGKENRSFED